MSNLAPNNANKVIALLSSNNSLQVGLLVSLIESELGLKQCSVVHEQEEIPNGCDLLLIDCSGESYVHLLEIASSIHSSEETYPSALLNAEQDSEHENLLDWPSISGIFYVDTEQHQLIRGLQCLLEGEFWVPRKLLHHLLQKNRKAPKIRNTDIKLTRREVQILKLIQAGASNAHISASLEVSEHTVKSHLYNVYKKIGVRNRLEASKRANDFFDPEG